MTSTSTPRHGRRQLEGAPRPARGGWHPQWGPTRLPGQPGAGSHGPAHPSRCIRDSLCCVGRPAGNDILIHGCTRHWPPASRSRLCPPRAPGWCDIDARHSGPLLTLVALDHVCRSTNGFVDTQPPTGDGAQRGGLACPAGRAIRGRPRRGRGERVAFSAATGNYERFRFRSS